MRWVLRVALALVVLAGAAAAWWFLWVPWWRPPLEAGEVYGIDVSAHQGAINWEKVANDGIEFAYVKATEGGDFTDRRFAENWREAQRVGLDRGAYHFFTLCRPGAEQAAHFLRIAPPDRGALAPAVDLELAGNCDDRPPRMTVERELDAFLAAVERAWAREAVLYVGDEWEPVYPVRTRLDRPLWHRRFLRRPPMDDWYIWQLHGYADVDGVTGGVDLNVMRTPRAPRIRVDQTAPDACTDDGARQLVEAFLASDREPDDTVASFVAPEPRFEWFSTRERSGMDVAADRSTLAAYIMDRRTRGVTQRLDELTFNGIDDGHANISFVIGESTSETTVTYPGKAAIDCGTEKLMLWSEGAPA